MKRQQNSGLGTQDIEFKIAGPQRPTKKAGSTFRAEVEPVKINSVRLTLRIHKWNPLIFIVYIVIHNAELIPIYAWPP